MKKSECRKHLLLASYLCFFALFLQAARHSRQVERTHYNRIHVVSSLKNANFGRESHSSVTLVTGYYSTSGKHTEDEYRVWISRYLSLSDNVVIFTQEEHVENFSHQRHRSKGSTLLVLSSLDDSFDNWVDWDEQYRLDPEKQFHATSDLYKIWNQKSDLVAETARYNPFNSTHFFWTDIGQFRDDFFMNKYLKPELTWIKAPHVVPPRKIIFLAIEKFQKSELKFLANGKSRTLNSTLVRLGGGNFGGDRITVRKWALLFRRKLYEYVQLGAFAGKDQPIYGSVCIESRICHIVDALAVRESADPWFAMQPVLHGDVHDIPVYELTP